MLKMFKMFKSSTDRPTEDTAVIPIHCAVASGNHATLKKLLSALPKPPDPTQILTEYESLAQENLAEQISAAIDTQDNPLKETPLHLAVRLGNATAVRALVAAGANVTLENAAGWNPLQEALLRRCRPTIVTPLVQHHHTDAWRKWRRRLPRLAAALRRVRDFYMEVTFNFESSIVPFVGKFTPSDTCRIWKRGGNLRADASFSGVDGLKVQRANQSILLLNDLNCSNAEKFGVPRGSLLVLNHDEKQFHDVFEELSDSEIDSLCNETHVHRLGIDVTKAELVGRTNWIRQEKKENVGDWKSRVYDMHNVAYTFRSREVSAAGNGDDRSVAPPLAEETEYTKSLRPVVWLTEEFPLKTEELLPLLDILASKVDAVRRMRELLTTTLPPGTFPVKVAIPVVPTVRVVITFSKFVELQPAVENFVNGRGSREEERRLRSGSGGGDGRQPVDPFSIPNGYRCV